jgi:hypothetical protein
MSLPAVPVIVVAPVFVTVDAARTPYVEVVPCLIVGPAAVVANDVDNVTTQILNAVVAAKAFDFDHFSTRKVLIQKPYLTSHQIDTKFGIEKLVFLEVCS